MENYNKTPERKQKFIDGLKLLGLLGILSVTTVEVNAQTSPEQLIKDAKMKEMKLSDNVAIKGKVFSTLNNYKGAQLQEGNATERVIYADGEAMKVPKSIIIYKDGKAYLDENADGKVDVVYVNRDYKAGENLSDIEFSKIVLTMGNGPEQTALDLNIDKKNCVTYYVNRSEVADMQDATISNIPDKDKGMVSQTLQGKYVKVLDSIINNDIK